MAQQTALQLYALPGRVHSFAAKDPSGAVISGPFRVVEQQVYVAGPAAQESYVAGPAAQESYVAGPAVQQVRGT